MPIRTSVPIKVFDQESFHQVDRRVTGIAFEIHNEFGRYLDERLYQRELARRLRDAGFDVEPELRMAVSLDDFRKDYCADLLVSQGVIIETKAVEAFSLTTSTHRPKAVFEHQQRFLRHTPLRAIQWINLNHHDIEVRTIER